MKEKNDEPQNIQEKILIFDVFFLLFIVLLRVCQMRVACGDWMPRAIFFSFLNQLSFWMKGHCPILFKKNAHLIDR